MERRNPADDRLDSLKSTRGLLSLLKRKRDAFEREEAPPLRRPVRTMDVTNGSPGTVCGS